MLSRSPCTPRPPTPASPPDSAETPGVVNEKTCAGAPLASKGAQGPRRIFPGPRVILRRRAAGVKGQDAGYCCSMEMSWANCSPKVSSHEPMGDTHEERQGGAAGGPARATWSRRGPVAPGPEARSPPSRPSVQPRPARLVTLLEEGVTVRASSPLRAGRAGCGPTATARHGRVEALGGAQRRRPLPPSVGRLPAHLIPPVLAACDAAFDDPSPAWPICALLVARGISRSRQIEPRNPPEVVNAPVPPRVRAAPASASVAAP